MLGDRLAEADESFTVNLGAPGGATLQDGQARGTILNDDAAVPVLTLGNGEIAEGDSGTRELRFTATLSQPAAQAVTARFATADDTARAGSDYVAQTGTLTFAPGETSKSIAILVNGDTEVEASEGFQLALSQMDGATLAPGGGQGVIRNDDVALPSLSVSDARVMEGNAGVTPMAFTISLSQASQNAVTVRYATQDGTAAAGSDFTATSGTVTFAAGETSRTVTVNVLADADVEVNETLSLVLSAPVGAMLADGLGQGAILNDDVAAAGGDRVAFRVAQSWNGGFIGEMDVINDATALRGWTVEFDAPFQIKSIWNAEIVSQVGNHYVVRNAPWNGDVAPLGMTSFGFDVAGAGTPQNLSINGSAPPPVLPGLRVADAALAEGNAGAAPMNFTVTLSAAATQTVSVAYSTADGTAQAGQDYVASAGTLNFAVGETSKTIAVQVLGDALREGNEGFSLNLTGPTGATLLDGQGLGTIRDDDAAVAPPATGYYSTSGNQIMDSNGEEVRLKAVNWFGMEGYLGVPDGLYIRNWQSMMEQMQEVGFDSIRLPFSLQNAQPGMMPNNINYSLNPDLVGLSNLQVLDKVVGHAGTLGMKIILDCHRSSSGAGPNENGLWYDGNFSEAQWINTWKALAQRYDGNSTVIGMDLQNEPHGASWTDWSAAAERAGNAIHEVNPNLLIVVEGVGNYEGDYYWWGGQLEGVRDDPVVLQVANKLVYSPHDYPNSIYPNTWFEGPNFKENLPNVFREHWGFIFEEGIAPILLGEFGTKLQDFRDIAWLDEITQYLNGDFNTDGVLDIPAGQEGMSFAYWSWNPNSTDTGGILTDDWVTVHQNKLAALESILIG